MTAPSAAIVKVMLPDTASRAVKFSAHSSNDSIVKPNAPSGLLEEHWNRFPLSFNPNDKIHSAGYDGKVYYSIYAHDRNTLYNPSGVMVVVPGMHLSDYFVTVLARNLSQEKGQVVYVLNPRGQGVSADKAVPETHQLTVPIESHVANLQHLLTHDILPAHKDKPVHILGHSYGGLILMHALTKPDIGQAFHNAGVSQAMIYAPFICPSRRAKLLGAVAPKIPRFNFPLNSIEFLCDPRVNKELIEADQNLGLRKLSFSFYTSVMNAQKQLYECIAQSQSIDLAIPLKVILPGKDAFIHDGNTLKLFESIRAAGKPVNVTIMPEEFNHTRIFDLSDNMADQMMQVMFSPENMCP